MFDSSDYPDNNGFGIPLVNKKVAGLIKDAKCGSVMTEFVGLWSKMHCIKVNGIEATTKSKGVKTSTVKILYLFRITWIFFYSNSY